MKQKARHFFQIAGQKLLIFFRKIFCLTKSKRIRKIVWIVVAGVSLIALVLGLLTGSIGTVGPRSIGLLSNSISHRIDTTTKPSGVYFAGLGAKYIELPKKGAKFEIEFRSVGEGKQGDIYQYPSFLARTNQGTPLNVSLFLTGELNIVDPTSGYALFYDKYGQDWTRFLSFAIPNIIRRVLSGMSFYDVTNQKIKSTAVPLLSTLDEFALTLVSINAQLATITNSSANTIGLQIYQKKAQLNFLNQTYDDLQTVANDNGFTTNNYGTLGANKATRDYTIMSNTVNTTNWTAGLDLINGIFTYIDSTTTKSTINITAAELYLWTYFQLFYNSSFVMQASQLQYQ